ncbi:Solute-binding protein [subsurface metagenome]
MVEEATGGRLVLDTKIMLVPHAEVIDAVIDGRADIGTQWIPFNSGTYPLLDFGALPFFWANHPWEYEKAINDPRLISILDEYYWNMGAVRLCAFNSNTIDAIFARKPIDTVDDFEGLKVRVIGQIPTLTCKLMGAAPLVMPLGEVADAVRLGTVDAVSAGITFGLGTLGMADVSTHVSIWPIEPEYGSALIVNQKSWDALPADLQQIVREVSIEWQGQEYLAVYCHDKTMKVDVLATGLTLVTPDKAEIDKAAELTQPAIEEWLEISGPRAQEVMDIILEYATGPGAEVYKASH